APPEQPAAAVAPPAADAVRLPYGAPLWCSPAPGPPPAGACPRPPGPLAHTPRRTEPDAPTCQTLTPWPDRPPGPAASGRGPPRFDPAQPAPGPGRTPPAPRGAPTRAWSPGPA